MSRGLEIRPLRRDDIEGCAQVIASLPRFFGVESDIPQVARDLGSQGGLVTASPAGDIIGFVTWKRHTASAAEITWMAVHSALRGRGVGSALLKRLEPLLAASGYQHISLLTSAKSMTYEPTRGFWQARGYEPIIALDELWETDIALVYTKVVSR